MSGTIDGATPPLTHAVFARYPRVEEFGYLFITSADRPCERWKAFSDGHAAAEDLPSDARDAAQSDAFVEAFGGGLVWMLQLDVPSHQLGLVEPPTGDPPIDPHIWGDLKATADLRTYAHRSELVSRDLTVHEADGEILDASLSVRLALEQEPRDVYTLELEMLAVRCDGVLE